MKFLIEINNTIFGISYTAIKKEHDGKVVATAYDLATEDQAVNFIRERWSHRGSIYVYDYVDDLDRTIRAL